MANLRRFWRRLQGDADHPIAKSYCGSGSITANYCPCPVQYNKMLQFPYIKQKLTQIRPEYTGFKFLQRNSL